MADPMQPIRTAPPEVRQIIERVLRLERERLYEDKPHLNADVLRIIKEEVKCD